MSKEGRAYEQSVAQSDDGVNLQVLTQGASAPRGAFSPEQRAIALMQAAGWVGRGGCLKQVNDPWL